MKVLLVNSWHTIGSKGGAEKIFCELSNALAERGHDVVMVCFDKQKGYPSYALDQKVRFINAGLYPVRLQNKKILRNILSFSFSSARRRNKRAVLYANAFKEQFLNAVKDRRFDIAISFQPHTTFSLKGILEKDIPIVTMSHNRTDVTFPTNLATVVLNAVEQSAAIQVLRPEFKKEVLEKIPHANVIVIPNVVPQLTITASLDTKKIINVGRITDQKRQVLLVQAFALIKDEFPHWFLEIWGEKTVDEVYCRLVQAEIAKCKLTERVSLCGVTDHIVEVLSDASIFVFPSRHEGWGLALTEAMSLGLPSIGCVDCSAVNSLVKHNENGLLCLPTPEALADSLRRLIQDQSLRERLGKKAKEDMKNYAPEVVWNKWEETLVALCQQK